MCVCGTLQERPAPPAVGAARPGGQDDPGGLSDKEDAWAMSHFGVWREIAKLPPGSVGLVLEDDVVFLNGWRARLAKLRQGAAAQHVPCSVSAPPAPPAPSRCLLGSRARAPHRS